ncbi:MAG: proline--tRNA ligase [Candidatus Aenigmatarchaeota archaeon]
MSKELGINTKMKDNFAKWYLEVVRKGNFIDQRSPIKGCDVITPWGYAIWELIKNIFDAELKKNNVKNAYFPIFIPERFLRKEEEHFVGFKAETVMATEAGGKRLEEKLAIRPTSETIMYYMYNLWIRSYKDLPLLINQWNNIVRWDTKVTRPFIRGREFLWQEGHTAHATYDDAYNWINRVIEMYDVAYRAMALDKLLLKRPKFDTFAGAEFSVVFDTIVQDGKIIQGPGTHMLGQNFSKTFNIKFTDKNGKKQYVWQTSWGMSTRQIGILIMHHGDDKGAILPPAIAPYQAVIVPILFKGKEKIILDKCIEVKKELEKIGVRVYLDNRDYSAGFKFNEWELKGIPLRIEIGPKDIENKEITYARRIGGKGKIKINELKNAKIILDEIQNEMYEKSKKFTKENINIVKNIGEIKSIKKGVVKANWCGSSDCADNIKFETKGFEIRGTLYEKEEKPFGPCIYCDKKAEHVVYLAKAY